MLKFISRRRTIIFDKENTRHSRILLQRSLIKETKVYDNKRPPINIRVRSTAHKGGNSHTHRTSNNVLGTGKLQTKW